MANFPAETTNSLKRFKVQGIPSREFSSILSHRSSEVGSQIIDSEIPEEVGDMWSFPGGRPHRSYKTCKRNYASTFVSAGVGPGCANSFWSLRVVGSIWLTPWLVGILFHSADVQLVGMWIIWLSHPRSEWTNQPESMNLQLEQTVQYSHVLEGTRRFHVKGLHIYCQWCKVVHSAMFGTPP